MAKCAFEDLADIIEVLQPLPSTKMTWCSNFIIVGSLCLLLCLAPLVLQGVDCALLAPQTPLPKACIFYSTLSSPLLSLVGAGMHWLQSADCSMKQ